MSLVKPTGSRPLKRLFASRLARTALVLLVLVGISGGYAYFRSEGTSGGANSPAAVTYLSPSGHGDCTRQRPCADLRLALIAAGDGGTVLLTSGQYPPLDVAADPAFDQRTRNVTVRPEPNASPVFGQLRTSAAHVTYYGFEGNGVLYLRAGAAENSIEHVHLTGDDASIIIRSNHVSVSNSVIEGGVTRDGINIAGQPPNYDITISNNTIRDFAGGTLQQEHPDCIQLFDTSRVIIRQNSLYDCHNSGITFSGGARLGLHDITVVGNFVQGCVPERQKCGNGGAAMDLRTHVTNVLVEHNTFGYGSVRLVSSDGVRAPANIVRYLSTADCTTSFSASLIMAYTSKCKTTPGSDQGNWKAPVSFRDLATNDLTPVAPLPDVPQSSAVLIAGGVGVQGPVSAGTPGAASW